MDDGETTLAHWHGKPESCTVIIQPGQVGLPTMKVGRYDAALHRDNGRGGGQAGFG